MKDRAQNPKVSGDALWYSEIGMLKWLPNLVVVLYSGSKITLVDDLPRQTDAGLSSPSDDTELIGNPA